jgi:hypothetical protein
MTSPRKPSAGFWITVTLFVVLVGYPLSFGPACWIYSRTDNQTLPQAYLPVGWLMSNVPRSVEMASIKYALAGMPRGSHIVIPVAPEHRSVLEQR